jgi:hypothetical protein
LSELEYRDAGVYRRYRFLASTDLYLDNNTGDEFSLADGDSRILAEREEYSSEPGSRLEEPLPQRHIEVVAEPFVLLDVAPDSGK